MNQSDENEEQTGHEEVEKRTNKPRKWKRGEGIGIGNEEFDYKLVKINILP